jgi:hypothetical protein
MVVAHEQITTLFDQNESQLVDFLKMPHNMFHRCLLIQNPKANLFFSFFSKPKNHIVND